MNYIVFDLEWNQGRDGKQGRNHEEIPFEIIEFGAIKLDEGKNVIGEFHQLVKPSVYKNMHYITENMLHIHMEDLKGGKSFKEVMDEFLLWCGEDYLFCTWGSLDLLELQRNMRYHDMEPLSDGPICFLDVQKLFSIAFEEDKKSRRALEYAVDVLSVEKDIAFHRAFSDAYYTAKVLQKIPEDIEEYCSYDVFHLPTCKEKEIQKIFPSYAKYISREFEDKSAAIIDREVISTRCYICDKNAKRKIKWFTSNGKHYYSISYCDKHGFIKGKIRIRKGVNTPSDSESVYVIKTLKIISEEEMKVISEKRDHARKQRQIKRKIAKKKNTET
jgi:inhibitor of KinA sporulation pathway (predicted exonuclease)